MRQILLIEKEGKRLYVITQKVEWDSEVCGFTIKSTKTNISREKLTYRLTSLENGEEKAHIGYISTLNKGECVLYEVDRSEDEGREFGDVSPFVTEERINILETVYNIS